MKRLLSILTALALVAITGAMSVVAADEDIVVEGDDLHAASEDEFLSDVTGLSAEAGDGEVTLTWDAVEGANAYVIFYGTESVPSGGNYNLQPIEIGNVTTYTVPDLTSGTTYYFSIAGANNEILSESYGEEVSATPTGEASGSGAAAIVGADATDSTTVRVVFSADMNFVADLDTAVTIINGFDAAELGVESVTVVDNRTLSITTATQDPGVEYELTVAETVTDATGDTLSEADRFATFIGSINTPSSEDFEVETAISGTDDDGYAVEVTFSEEVTLGDDPTTQLAIVETDNPNTFLEITEVLVNSDDASKVLIRTGEHSAVAYTLIITEVTNSIGQTLSDENSTFEFGGVGYEGEDTTPPEDISSLRAQLTDLATAAVSLTWGASPNTAEDLANHLVYFSTDRGATYELLQTLDSDALTFDDSGFPEADVYTFKVTTRDTAGNESEGKTVTLPGTGPAGLLALAMSSLGFGRLASRRRK